MEHSSENKYSYFWGIWLVFIAFAIVYSLQLKAAFDQKRQLKTSLKELQKVLPQAKYINGTMADMSRELLVMAPNSPAARQIVTDFKIKSVPSQKEQPKNKD